MKGALHFLFSLFITVVAGPASVCDRYATDVVFIVDASIRIRSDDFTMYVLPFVQNLVNMFDVGPADDQTHVGMVTIDNDVHLGFHLNTFDTKDDIINAIGRTSRGGRENFMHKALAFITKEMFSEKNGARKGVDHVAVVLTYGISGAPERTMKTAEVAKEQGILIFAIGVGSLVDVTELEAIASNPADKFSLPLSSFKYLGYVKETLVMEVCDRLVGPQ